MHVIPLYDVQEQGEGCTGKRKNGMSLGLWKIFTS